MIDFVYFCQFVFFVPLCLVQNQIHISEGSHQRFFKGVLYICYITVIHSQHLLSMLMDDFAREKDTSIGSRLEIGSVAWLFKVEHYIMIY